MAQSFVKGIEENAATCFSSLNRRVPRVTSSWGDAGIRHSNRLKHAVIVLVKSLERTSMLSRAQTYVNRQCADLGS